MPNVTLSFDLPTERGEYDLVMKAGAYHHVLWEFSEWMRTRRKHAVPQATGAEELEVIWQAFWDTVNEESPGLLDE